MSLLDFRYSWWCTSIPDYTDEPGWKEVPVCNGVPGCTDAVVGELLAQLQHLCCFRSPPAEDCFQRTQFSAMLHKQVEFIMSFWHNCLSRNTNQLTRSSFEDLCTLASNCPSSNTNWLVKSSFWRLVYPWGLDLEGKRCKNYLILLWKESCEGKGIFFFDIWGWKHDSLIFNRIRQDWNKKLCYHCNLRDSSVWWPILYFQTVF